MGVLSYIWDGLLSALYYMLNFRFLKPTRKLIRASCTVLAIFMASLALHVSVFAMPDDADSDPYGLCDDLGYAPVDVRIRSGPSLEEEVQAILPAGGVVCVYGTIPEEAGDGWAMVWYNPDTPGFPSDVGQLSGRQSGYISLSILVTGLDALDQAIAAGNLYAKTNSEIPMYFTGSGTDVIDTMYPRDILHVTHRSGTRLELATYDGTSVYVEMARVSLANDREKRAEEQARAAEAARAAEEAARQREAVSARQAITDAIVWTAHQYLGRPYVHGGESFDTGIDCSSFVQKIYASCGIYLPRTSAEQYGACVPIGMESILPGDLVFYHGYYDGVPTAGIGHVAIYIGNGQIIHSRNAQRGVCIDPVGTLPIVAVGRCY